MGSLPEGGLTSVVMGLLGFVFQLTLHTDIRLIAQFRQIDLPLPLFKARNLFGRFGVMATWAAESQDEIGRFFISLADGLAAGAAQFVIAWLQTVSHTDSLVKHKTFTFLQALFRRHGFQVFQDATLEVIDLVKTLRL